MNLLKTLTQGGPVAVAHALHQAWLAHRVLRIRSYMEREIALHRMHMSRLRAERDALVVRLTNAEAQTTQFGKTPS